MFLKRNLICSSDRRTRVPAGTFTYNNTNYMNINIISRIMLKTFLQYVIIFHIRIISKPFGEACLLKNHFQRRQNHENTKAFQKNHSSALGFDLGCIELCIPGFCDANHQSKLYRRLYDHAAAKQRAGVKYICTPSTPTEMNCREFFPE